MACPDALSRLPLGRHAAGMHAYAYGHAAAMHAQPERYLNPRI